VDLTLYLLPLNLCGRSYGHDCQLHRFGRHLSLGGRAQLIAVYLLVATAFLFFEINLYSGGIFYTILHGGYSRSVRRVIDNGYF